MTFSRRRLCRYGTHHPAQRMRRARQGALLSALAVGSALSPHAQTVSGTPASANQQVTYSMITVPYASPGGRPLLADLYIPRGSGPFTVVLFIHGGGWSSGDRTQLHRQAAAMADRGFFGMAIDYRLAPADPYPAAFDDVRTAVLWLRANVSQYHLDATHIGAVGSSAGAHLAAMLATQGIPGNAGSSVQAVVAFNGIYDLNTMPPTTMISDFAGKPCAEAPAPCIAASPIARVKPGLPPILLMHGTADMTAPYPQASTFAGKLRAAGDPVTLFTVQDAPHTFWSKPQWANLSDETMAGFLIKQLSPAPSRPQPVQP